MIRPERGVALPLVGLLLALAACDAGGLPGLAITNARIVDGAGTPAVSGAVRVVDGRIAAVGPDVVPRSGDTVLDAGGLVLAPGFIDTHSHADSDLLERLDATAAVSQGITTLVVGQDGGSHHPLAGFRSRFEASPATVNVASYAGHNTFRELVMGEDFRREATPEEIAGMARLLEADLAAGALGLSTGLEYDPGIYSATDEVVALAHVAADAGGRYLSHLRSEDRWFWEAVEEIIRIGEETGMPVQVTHAKLALQSLWGEVPRLLGRLEEARAAGVDITLDVYPYPYWQSTLTVMFPERDFTDLEESRFVVSQMALPEGILIPTYAPEPAYAGRTLASIAAERGEEPAVTLLELIQAAEAMRAAPDLRTRNPRRNGDRHQHGRGRHRRHLRLGAREPVHRRRALWRPSPRFRLFPAGAPPVRSRAGHPEPRRGGPADDLPGGRSHGVRRPGPDRPRNGRGPRRFRPGDGFRPGHARGAP